MHQLPMSGSREKLAKRSRDFMTSEQPIVISTLRLDIVANALSTSCRMVTERVFHIFV